MSKFKNIFELKNFIILWLTQSFSTLGSAMTNFALIIWSYEARGSALSTAMLSVCSYAPYVIMSIFAGALSDRWNKKVTMLVCDTAAAFCTLIVLFLHKSGSLEIWHLYCLNAINGLMNTVQQPALDVARSVIVDKKYYQFTSGLRSISKSVVDIITPSASAAVLAFAGLEVVIFFDLATFIIAFISLMCFVKIPEIKGERKCDESLLKSAHKGIIYLKNNKGILHLILFLAAVNFTASIYNAALPAMVISKSDETALGVISTLTGVTMLVGGVIAAVMPRPKSRVRVIFISLFISMSTENFVLALGGSLPVWCIGVFLGWICIPIMNTNLDVIMRKSIPINIQGRVYSVRNSLQFFTIPLGYMAGGMLVDKIFEPFMSLQSENSLLCAIFGAGKGSGAALLFFIIGFAGVMTCIIFSMDKYIWSVEK